MMQMKQRQRHGYTLVELLFVLISLSLLMLVMIQITLGGTRTYNKGIAQMTVKQKMREAMEGIATDVRQAVPASASENGFISPPFNTGATGDFYTLEFYRYRSATADDAIPTANTRIAYRILEKETREINGISYTVGSLVREENSPAGINSEVLTTDVCIKDGSGKSTSYFAWREDPLTHAPDLSCLEIHLLLYHSTPDKNGKYEMIQLTTAASIRADRNIVGSSTYDPVPDRDYTTNLQRVGEPTSLVRPRE